MPLRRARPITPYGTPVLHAPAAPVTAFDRSLAKLAKAMFRAMYKADGVGLAAPQLDTSLRMFVYDCPDASGGDRVGIVCNPVLLSTGGEPITIEEGCLSLPGQWASLARPSHATVSGQDVHGAPITVRGDGLLARCLIHETEHLDGTLFIDHLPEDTRAALLAAHRKD